MREATVANDVCWWGDVLLGPHLFRLLGLRGVRAEVRFGRQVQERRIDLCCRRGSGGGGGDV